MPKPSYRHVLDSTIAGIPCQLGITHFLSVPAWKGSAWTCDSADDYYGYTEIEFDVLDRKGYKADWLASKLTDKENDRLQTEIEEFFADMDRDYY